MQKKIIRTATAFAMIALASTWGFPGVSRAEDFLDKLKKAAELGVRVMDEEEWARIVAAS